MPNGWYANATTISSIIEAYREQEFRHEEPLEEPRVPITEPENPVDAPKVAVEEPPLAQEAEDDTEQLSTPRFFKTYKNNSDKAARGEWRRFSCGYIISMFGHETQFVNWNGSR